MDLNKTTEEEDGGLRGEVEGRGAEGDREGEALEGDGGGGDEGDEIEEEQKRL